MTCTTCVLRVINILSPTRAIHSSRYFLLSYRKSTGISVVLRFLPPPLFFHPDACARIRL